MKLITHLRLVPRSKNEWSYTSTPNMPSWHGAQLQKSTGTTLLRRPRLGIDGRIILEYILGKYGERCGQDSFGSGWGPVVGSCEHVNKPLGSVKYGRFLN